MGTEEDAMPESEASRAALEEANSLFSNAPSLEELMAGCCPSRR
jgi:hypothetical protein